VTCDLLRRNQAGVYFLVLNLKVLVLMSHSRQSLWRRLHKDKLLSVTRVQPHLMSVNKVGEGQTVHLARAQIKKGMEEGEGRGGTRHATVVASKHCATLTGEYLMSRH